MSRQAFASQLPVLFWRKLSGGNARKVLCFSLVCIYPGTLPCWRRCWPLVTRHTEPSPPTPTPCRPPRNPTPPWFPPALPSRGATKCIWITTKHSTCQQQSQVQSLWRSGPVWRGGMQLFSFLHEGQRRNETLVDYVSQILLFHKFYPFCENSPRPSVFCCCGTYPLSALYGDVIAPMVASVARVAFNGSDSNHLSRIFDAGAVMNSRKAGVSFPRRLPGNWCGMMWEKKNTWPERKFRTPAKWSATVSLFHEMPRVTGFSWITKHSWWALCPYPLQYLLATSLHSCTWFQQSSKWLSVFPFRPQFAFVGPKIQINWRRFEQWFHRRDDVIQMFFIFWEHLKRWNKDRARALRVWGGEGCVGWLHHNYVCALHSLSENQGCTCTFTSACTVLFVVSCASSPHLFCDTEYSGLGRTYPIHTSASFCENCAICCLLFSSLLDSVRDLAFPCGSNSGVYEVGFRMYTLNPCFLSSISLIMFGRKRLKTYEALENLKPKRRATI